MIIFLIFFFLLSKDVCSELIEISLKDVVGLVQGNNKELLINKKDIEMAKMGIKKETSELYPQLSLKTDVSYKKYLKVKKFTTETKIDGETYKLYMDEQISPPYDTFFSLSLSQALYTGGKLSASIQQAKNELKGENLEYEIKKEELIRKAKEAYYSLLEASEKERFYKDAQERAQILYNITQEKLKGGFVAEIDAKRVKINLEEAKGRLISAKREIELAEDALKRLCGLSPDAILKLKETLAAKSIEVEREEAIDFSLKNRKEIKKQKVVIEEKEVSLKIAKSLYLPKVSLEGSYLWQGEGKSIKKAQKDIKERQWSFSLNAELPIFDGGRRYSEKKIGILSLEKEKERLEEIKTAIIFEVREAIIKLKEQEERVKNTQDNLDLTKENFQIIKTKYELGKVSLTEVFDVEDSLNKISINYIEAIYDYELSKIAFYKAIGEVKE